MNQPINLVDLKALALSSLPAGRSKALDAYLTSLQSPTSRRALGSALDRVARILFDVEARAVPWHLLRYEHMAALRAYLAERYAPASANTMLAAVRGVLRNAWKLEELDTDSYLRAMDFKPVRGERLPAGRALKRGEIRVLFAVCAADPSPAGSRDAAAFAMLFGAGLRRSEAVGVQRDDYDSLAGTLTIIGKGNRQRTVYATGGGAVALRGWLRQRGKFPGALLAPVNKGGKVQPRPMTAQALLYRLKVRCDQASIPPCSPHDLRRTFVSELLDAGADISAVQKLAGHQSPTTTARYDRRGERAMKRAAEMLVVPYRPVPTGRAETSHD